MKICIISSQIAGFGKEGGFGVMTRKIAEALSRKGHDVSVVVPRRTGQKGLEKKKGLKIYGLTKLELFSKKVFREIDADVYHSENPNFSTFIAMLAQPDKKHVITCRDPRSTYDWLIETIYATWKRRLKTFLVYPYEGSFFVSYAVRNADVVGCPAKFLIKKVNNLYGIKDTVLLPNLQPMPRRIPKKSKKPKVCFVGRLDKRKRPEIVLDLAEKFPDVEFVIAGKAEDKSREVMLEQKASLLKNVKLLGHVDHKKLRSVYASSWILINTAAREGLPLTFIEAASNGCAILSQVNPDSFSSKFGFHCKSGTFKNGLKNLLKSNKWRRKGRKAYGYVRSVYDEKTALEKHEKIYKTVLGEK